MRYGDDYVVGNDDKCNTQHLPTDECRKGVRHGGICTAASPVLDWTNNAEKYDKYSLLSLSLSLLLSLARGWGLYTLNCNPSIADIQNAHGHEMSYFKHVRVSLSHACVWHTSVRSREASGFRHARSEQCSNEPVPGLLPVRIIRPSRCHFFIPIINVVFSTVILFDIHGPCPSSSLSLNSRLIHICHCLVHLSIIAQYWWHIYSMLVIFGSA